MNIKQIEKKAQVEMLLDLYEIRAGFTHPMPVHYTDRYGIPNTENVIRYNFFNMAIAKLQDKYKITGNEIMEALRERNLNKSINPLERNAESRA